MLLQEQVLVVLVVVVVVVVVLFLLRLMKPQCLSWRCRNSSCLIALTDAKLRNTKGTSVAAEVGAGAGAGARSSTHLLLPC